MKKTFSTKQTDFTGDYIAIALAFITLIAFTALFLGAMVSEPQRAKEIRTAEEVKHSIDSMEFENTMWVLTRNK